MAKRKITVTVDEELVESVQALGAESLSAVVNEALAQEVERRARAAALGRLLADWDAAHGPVATEEAAAAAAAFDDLDAVAVKEPHAPARRRRGAA
jgi:predicted transcriptional regulator